MLLNKKIFTFAYPLRRKESPGEESGVRENKTKEKKKIRFFLAYV